MQWLRVHPLPWHGQVQIQVHMHLRMFLCSANYDTLRVFRCIRVRGLSAMSMEQPGIPESSWDSRSLERCGMAPALAIASFSGGSADKLQIHAVASRCVEIDIKWGMGQNMSPCTSLQLRDSPKHSCLRTDSYSNVLSRCMNHHPNA